jgi:hypothetical protein
MNENETEILATANAVNAERAAARILVAHTSMSMQQSLDLVTLIVLASMSRSSAALAKKGM